MPHDASKVLLGATQSNEREVTSHASDPATFLAGLVCSVGSDGLLSLAKSAGMRAGVSLGRDLSNAKYTALLRTGEKVPVRLALKRASGVITISSYANLVSGTDDVVTIGGQAFTAQAGAATPGDATFQAATSNAATATSLAAQINAHTATAAKVYAVVTSSGVVTVYSKVAGVGSTGTGNDIGLTYTDNDTNVGITLSGLSSNKLSGGSDTIGDASHVVKGAKMYVNDATGEADLAMSGFSTITDAIYVDSPKTGIAEDSSETPVAIVDMVGGL